MDFFNQIAGTVQSAVQSNQQQGGQQQQMQNTAGTTQQAGGAGGLHLPKEILQVIDKYVDCKSGSSDSTLSAWAHD